MGVDVKFGMNYVMDYGTGKTTAGYGPQISYSPDAPDVARTGPRERIVIRSSSELMPEPITRKGALIAGAAALGFVLAVGGVALLSDRGAHPGGGGTSTISDEDFGFEGHGTGGVTGMPGDEDF